MALLTLELIEYMFLGTESVTDDNKVGDWSQLVWCNQIICNIIPAR